MKRNTKPHTSLKMALAAAIALPLLAPAVRAGDGTWTNDGTSGPYSWSTSNNWQNMTIAHGAGSTAYFNTINVPTNSGGISVSVDTYDTSLYYGITNANLLFGDTDTSDGAANWTLTEGNAGITLDSLTTSNSIIDVSLATGSPDNLTTGWGTLTMNAGLHGTNTLVKSGPSPMIMNVANDYTGGTIISNGIIELGSGMNDSALNQGPVIFYGGSLSLSRAALPGANKFPSTSSDTAYAGALVVPAGQTGTIYMTPYALPTLSGTVSGSGTLNMVVEYVRDEMRNDWSGFSGNLVVWSSHVQNSDFRIGSSFNPDGLANTHLIFTNNPTALTTVSMYNAGLPATNFLIGELSSTVPGVVSISSHNTGPGTRNSAPMTLVVGGLNTDSEFAGNFSGDSGGGYISIVKVGTGTWTLDGPTVAYGGSTVISNGVLQIGKGTSGTLGLSAVVTNEATLAFGRSDTMTVTNVIDGSGNVEQVGDGMLVLAPSSGANTYSGKTIVKSGSLAVPSANALGTSPASFAADQLTLDGGSFLATSDFMYNDPNRGITLGAAGGGLGAESGSTLTVSSAIAGSGDLTISHSGVVALQGANNYTGKTILSSGTLMLSQQSSMGAAPASATADQLTLNGGTLESTATFAIDDANRGVTLAGAGGTISPDAATTLTISEAIAGSGTLTKGGAGTLMINGADSATGNTMINQGALALGASGAISGSPMIWIASGATFDVSAGSFSLGSGQMLAGNGTVVGNLGAGSGSTISAGSSIGALTVTGDLTLNGATNVVEMSSTTNDMLTVSGNLTLTGVSTIQIALLETLPNGSYPLIKYGTLTGDASNLSLQGYPLSRRTAVLVVNSANHSIDLSISGANGSLTWTGGANGNVWDVNTTMNWLNGASKDVFLNGDSPTFSDVGSTNPTVNIAEAIQPGIITVDSTTDYTFSGAGSIGGAASLVKSGSDTLTVLTMNDFIGGSTISSGTVQVGNGTTGGSLGAGDIVNNAALNFNLPSTLSVGGAISGTGSVGVQGGTAVLTANNSYGNSSISSGATLQVGNGGASGSVGTGAVANNGTLAYNRSGAVTNSGSITGSGNLSVDGGGTVVLAANNGYSGATTINSGVLQVGAGGTSGTLGSAGSVAVNSGGMLAFARSDKTTNSVMVMGAGGLRQEAGTLVLVSSNSYGATLIDAASTLQVGNGDTNFAYTVLTTNIDTVNMITNVITNFFGSVTLGAGTITDNGVLVLAQPYASTLTNDITGAGSVMSLGAGNLSIQKATANTYSGGTTISNSEVILAPPAGLSGQPLYDAVNALNLSGLGTGPITFMGTNGSLQLAWGDQQDPNAGISPNFPYTINVPAGQSGTVWVPGRYDDNTVLTGSGTYNIGVNYVRGNFRGDWSGFSGQVNIITNSVKVTGTSTAFDFREFNPIGIPNAKVHIGAGADIQWQGSGTPFVPLGDLRGDPGSFVAGGNWDVGGLNTDATFDGVISGGSIVKSGTGKWTLTGANSTTGTMTVSNGVLAFGVSPVDGITVGSISSASTITVAAPGVIDASGFADNTLQVSSILAGNGTVKGGVLVYGTIAPGFDTNGLGNLTISSNLVMSGIANFMIDQNPLPVNDMITCTNVTISDYATINITEMSTNDLVTGATFKLFSTPVNANISTLAVSLPQYNLAGTIPYVWTNKLAIDGTIQLLSGATSSVNMNPPPINFAVSGNTLSLSWPTNAGWVLQEQTNSLTTGLGNNWVDVPGSGSITSTNITVDPNAPTVFYRLRPPGS